MYFKNENGEKVKENFKLFDTIVGTTPPPDLNKCQNGFKFDLTTILLLFGLIVIAVILWKYNEIFPNESVEKLTTAKS